MNHNITRESFDSLVSCWTETGNNLNWSSVFILPAWLKTWWQVFRPEAELYMVSVREEKGITGIAPLMVSEGTASFIGSTNVCDYLDFIIVPGMEKQFFDILLDDLIRNGVNQIDLRHIRPDSTVLTNLSGIARDRGYEVHTQQEDISIEMDLPSNWEEYLEILNKKQRHEIKRKLRRLQEAGNQDYHYAEISYNDKGIIAEFLRLFSLSREEKSNFMTDRMELFFRSLTEAMAEIGLLRFGVLELETQPVAIVMGFDYNGSMYLYNSAYDPQYNSLSVGLLSKVFCIKESIQSGHQKFNFLKGNEPYKYYLGGYEIPLYRCQITIK